ncbi:tRNA (guanine-N(7)-)-methyltransferase non-catalytic subunit wdr4-like [Dysidea avara]|uniref:tRNA (guanine-N(7)-)-methyltransferase non-catalytic subunit wdr4-like n=1 Tax=Dysidea avara TaxID=196820 RepID=UPI0033316ED3
MSEISKFEKNSTKTYSTDDIGKESTFLLGHLSMLLDMVITMDQKYVITADRDEKIRISHFPNAYNIKAYCLGHNDFISCLLQCIHYEHVLISGSGDGTVKTWDFEHGRLLHTEFCSSPRTIGLKPNPVSCVAALCTKPFIAVVIESDPNVTVYEIRSDGILTTNCSVTLEASSFSVCFDGSGGMCLHRKFLKFECFEIESDSIFSGMINSDVLVGYTEGKLYQIRKTNSLQLLKTTVDYESEQYKGVVDNNSDQVDHELEDEAPIKVSSAQDK